MIDRKNSINLISSNNYGKNINVPQTTCILPLKLDKHQKQRSALHPHENYQSHYVNERE